MAATLFDAAGAPELEHLAIEPPHRRMRRIRERQSLIHRAPLGEILFARRPPAVSHGSLRHRHAALLPFCMDLFSRRGSRPPSPRVRGEGRGEGAFPPGSDSRQRPLTRIVSLRSTLRPLPAQRGEVKKANPLSRRVRARVLPTPRARKRCVMIPSGQAGGGTGVAMITCSKVQSVARMSICSPDEANGSGPKWPAR